MAPAEANREHYTLPYFVSWTGTLPYMPYDTAQSEYLCNPFKFDLGCMGAVFHMILKGRERYIPMLAPPIDMMTTRDLLRRFTAEQALSFVENIRRPLTDAQLGTENVEVESTGCPYFEYDWWAALPQDFPEKWAVYREHPVPVYIGALLWLHFFIDQNVSSNLLPLIRQFCEKFMFTEYYAAIAKSIGLLWHPRRLVTITTVSLI